MNEPFDTIEEALADIAAGKLVIVTDDENRENEGDLVMAASKATPETVNMMIRHARGLICVPMTEAQLKRAVVEQTNAQHAYRQAQERLAHIEQRSAQHEREWQARFDDLLGQALMSREVKHSLPQHWRSPERIREMQAHYGNATQARLRAEAVDRELTEGQWETDATVVEQLTLMNANVLRQEDELGQRKASNAAAAINMPDWQYPHCGTCSSIQACCRRCSRITSPRCRRWRLSASSR